MTLTFELIRDIVKVNPSTKFWVRASNGSARRVLTDKHTHTQTHETDFIPSTADAGGNYTAGRPLFLKRVKEDNRLGAQVLST